MVLGGRLQAGRLFGFRGGVVGEGVAENLDEQGSQVGVGGLGVAGFGPEGLRVGRDVHDAEFEQLEFGVFAPVAGFDRVGVLPFQRDETNRHGVEKAVLHQVFDQAGEGVFFAVGEADAAVPGRVGAFDQARGIADGRDRVVVSPQDHRVGHEAVHLHAVRVEHFLVAVHNAAGDLEPGQAIIGRQAFRRGGLGDAERKGSLFHRSFPPGVNLQLRGWCCSGS